MILEKCCHDLDYLIRLCGSRVERVSSFGSLFHFRPENAPAGSALRCLDGCAAKEACPYDAEKIYLTNEGTGVCRGQVGWPVDVLSEHPTRETILDAIRTGPYGRCVYRCDNDVVDNQVVNLQMESGAALTLTMSAFTSVGGRSIRILGTMGDLCAELRDEAIRVCEFGKQPEMLPLDGLGAKDGHAGGDRSLIETFLDDPDGKDVGDSVTTLEASVESHLAALAAEQSRLQGGMPVELGPMRG